MHSPDEGRTKVFISYSHQDGAWLKRLQVHLKPLERDGLIDRWDDTRIRAGSQWRNEIISALNTARVAVLLISADFMASDFIATDELPPLLAAAEQEDLKILSLIISPSSFDKTESLSRFQSVNPPSKPLIALRKDKREQILVNLAEEIKSALQGTSSEGHSANPTTQALSGLGGVGKTQTVPEYTYKELIDQLNGRDPILADDASQSLLTKHKELLIKSTDPSAEDKYNAMGGQFMYLVTSVMGESIVPHLIQDIEKGSWETKFSAATCFSLLSHSKAAESALIGLINKGGLNYDARRAVVEALGIIGADWCASYLIKYLKYGRWIEDSNEYLTNGGINEDHIAKLYPYVISALAKFAVKSTDHDVSHTIFKYLADLITQNELYRYPAHDLTIDLLITRIGHEFTPHSIDVMMNLWGNSEHEILQQRCCEILGYIAPVRAAKYLLNKASSSATPASVRLAASMALGEIRHPLAAEQLAIKLKHSGTDRTYLDWAFSTLYALPADWSGLSDYVDKLLADENEQCCQLRYSLALKRDGRCQTALVEHLDHGKPYIRWTSALALARLLGPNSRKYLDQRFEEANDVLERCGLYAAVIHAGNYEEVGALHKGLCELYAFSSLRSVWKLEILDAFRIVQTFDNRAFSLWAKVSNIGQTKLKYFTKLFP